MLTNMMSIAMMINRTAVEHGVADHGGLGDDNVDDDDYEDSYNNNKKDVSDD